MSIIKEALRQRNSLIAYVKKCVYGMQVPVGLKRDLDIVIDSGNFILDNIDLMYWTDTEFLRVIIDYLFNSERIVKQLSDTTEMPQFIELLYCIGIQRKVFLYIIRREISNPANQLVKLPSDHFKLFLSTIEKPE